MALVPMADLHIVDDWETAGLRGSGSVSTVAKDVFVPERAHPPAARGAAGPVRVGEER